MGKFFSKTIVQKNLFWATTAFFIGAFLTGAEYSKWGNTLDEGCSKIGDEFVVNKYKKFSIFEKDPIKKGKMISDGSIAQGSCLYVFEKLDSKHFNSTWGFHILGLWGLMAFLDYMSKESFSKSEDD